MKLTAIWILIIGFTVAYFVIDFITYRESSYYKITHNLYIKLKLNFDIGAKGEYLTYIKLRKYEEDGGKFLFNIYLPKGEEKTTEIDVLLIHKTGLYVFESKNYSGWIFGKENERNWTQSIPQGKSSKKEHFLNPIWQNKLHIKCLNDVLNEDLPVHSIIVFSERCELKKVELQSKNVKVIKRDILKDLIDKISAAAEKRIDDNKISEIYEKLYPLTQVSDKIKQKHIEDIESEKSDSN